MSIDLLHVWSQLGAGLLVIAVASSSGWGGERFAAGTLIDSLFFADDYVPRLLHKYQFNLDSEAGRQAPDRLVAFSVGPATGAHDARNARR